MEYFENQNGQRDSENESDSSDGNDLLFQFIFGKKNSKQSPLKNDRNEYRIRVDTDLKDPVNILYVFMIFRLLRGGLRASLKS